MKNEVYVQFSIQGSDIDPLFITEYLEVEPSRVWSKGDPKTKKSSLLHKNNGWEISISKKNILHIDESLDEILTLLFPKKNKLGQLNDVTKKLSIVVYAKQQMPSFFYNQALISFLYETGIELDHDIYCI